jgi:hypothetical protein
LRYLNKDLNEVRRRPEGIKRDHQCKGPVGRIDGCFQGISNVAVRDRQRRRVERKTVKRWGQSQSGRCLWPVIACCY